MVIDITIIIILTIYIFLGYKQCFLRSFLSAFGWFISFVCVFFIREPVKQFLLTKTTIKDDISVKITEFASIKFVDSSFYIDSDLYNNLPDIAISALKKTFYNDMRPVIEETTVYFTDALISLFSIVIIIVCIRMCTWLLEHLIYFFIGKNKPLDLSDNIFGMAFSLIKGLFATATLLTFVFIIAIVGNFPQILAQIESSFIYTRAINAGIFPNPF